MKAHVFGNEVFVRIGGSLYRRTHISVLTTACETCGAKVGEFCVNAKGEPTGVTHYQRRRDHKHCGEKPPTLVAYVRAW